MFLMIDGKPVLTIIDGTKKTVVQGGEDEQDDAARAAALIAEFPPDSPVPIKRCCG